MPLLGHNEARYWHHSISGSALDCLERRSVRTSKLKAAATSHVEAINSQICTYINLRRAHIF